MGRPVFIKNAQVWKEKNLRIAYDFPGSFYKSGGEMSMDGGVGSGAGVSGLVSSRE